MPSTFRCYCVSCRKTIIRPRRRQARRRISVARKLIDSSRIDLRITLGLVNLTDRSHLNAAAFVTRQRDFSAWVGLVPKQNSSGGKDRLGSISKQGDRYLRSLFTARALGGATMDVGGWLRSLGLERYEAAFREHEIDRQVLPSLTQEDLKELGVGSVGHRPILLEAIAALRADKGGTGPSADIKAAYPAQAGRAGKCIVPEPC
jgi:hypothetical protein